jgi:hypothetical protein
MTSSTQPPPGFFALFPVIFVGMWLAIGALFAQMSGWSELANEFPGKFRPEGPRLRRQVVKLGSVNENGVTTLVLSTAGLFLESIFLFRFRRPPVLVPWPALRYLGERRFLWQRWHEFDLGGITTIGVKTKAYDAIARFASAA